MNKNERFQKAINLAKNAEFLLFQNKYPLMKYF